MARPRKLPDADKLHELRTTGGTGTGLHRRVKNEPWTYADLAEEYDVTVAAVHLALQKSHLITAPRPRYAEDIPWKVAIEHSNDYRLSMLRLAAREKAGQKISESKLRYLRNWVENLGKPREGAPDGVVIDYDRDFYQDGFAYVPRLPEDDWIIRRPIVEEAEEAS